MVMVFLRNLQVLHICGTLRNLRNHMCQSIDLNRLRVAEAEAEAFLRNLRNHHS